MLKEKIYLEENKYVKINAIIGSVSFWVLMFIVFWSYKQPKNEKNQIIISIVVVITLTILLILFSFIKIKFHRWVFVFLIFAGILSLFIQPVLNIPDEAAHFARAEMISEGHIIVGQKDKEFPSIQSVNDLQHFGKTAFTKTDLKNKKINYTPTTVKHVAATNLSFLYLPQTMGILLAKVLHMDAIWLLWFGRIMNLLCYGIIVASAVKIAPKWKFVLFFMASLPMSIQQAASFSPDAIINGLSILTIGYFIYLYDKKTITIKEYCIFEILCILIPLAKITNIFIAGLNLLLPMENVEKKKRLLVTLGLFVLPAIVFIVGLVLADGNKSNIFTVVAVVGCLPGCRAAVGFIMMVMQKPVDKAVYDAIEAKKGKLLMGYEMYITQEKSSLMIEAAAFCGEEIACYTTRAKDQKQIEDCTTYLNKIIRANGYKCHVKIFDREKAFLERLDSLNRNYDELEKSASENFKPDERYPDLSRTELVKHTMLALAL